MRIFEKLQTKFLAETNHSHIQRIYMTFIFVLLCNETIKKNWENQASLANLVTVFQPKKQAGTESYWQIRI